MATAKKTESTATFTLAKSGPNGRPLVEVAVAGNGSLENLTVALKEKITRDPNIMKKLGLKACPACISGADIIIRHRFDDVITTKF